MDETLRQGAQADGQKVFGFTASDGTRVMASELGSIELTAEQTAEVSADPRKVLKMVLGDLLERLDEQGETAEDSPEGE